MGTKFIRINGVRVYRGSPLLKTEFRTQIGASFLIGPTDFAVFECSCGTVGIARLDHVRHGRALSCGCHKDRCTAIRKTKHGASTTREYKIWAGIKKRCTNFNATNFDHYGGRGISMCQAWAESFEVFLADMGPSPSPSHSIDRYPDQGGNYEPSNCRWATTQEQRNNMTSNRVLTIYGKSMTLTQWSRISGVRPETIRSRLEKGMEVKPAVFTPARKAAV